MDNTVELDDDPCDCGTVRGASGFYLLHECGGHPDCTGADEEPCMWFARCENPATGTTPHPVLGDVPTCARCAAFAAS